MEESLIRNLAQLNKRLMDLSGLHDVISDAQFRFKPGSGTWDAIFASILTWAKKKYIAANRKE